MTTSLCITIYSGFHRVNYIAMIPSAPLIKGVKSEP